VVFDGGLGDEELLDDLEVGQSSPDEDGDLLFAVGEPFCRFVSRW
jgi:hypothetical protein